eukprot:COSAG04_NODE_1274_length_7465_cov_4.194542_2_plen_846_part_00
MRVTKAELQDITGSDDPTKLVELNLANKYVDDLGYCSKLTQLQDANLAFNELRSLEGLASCADMRSLNVMHNKLKSLGGVEALRKLDCLRAAKNRISDVSALTGAAELSELWLQNNRVRDVAAFAGALKGLPKLQKLVFKPNPCCAEEADQKLCRQYLLSQLRGLEFLDGEVSNGEREAADTYLASDAGKAALQALLERMADGGSDKGRPKSGAKGGGEDDEVPRGQWTKSEVTSKLNTGSRRRRPTTRERKQRRPGSNKATGKENEEEGEPRRGMVTRSGPGSRPRSGARRRKEKKKPATPKQAETPSSAEISEEVAPRAAAELEELEDPVLANAKRLLAAQVEVEKAAVVESMVTEREEIETEPEKAPSPFSEQGKDEDEEEGQAKEQEEEEEEEEEDETLANAKRLLAGLAAAGLTDAPTDGPTPPLVPTPPRSSGGRSSASVRSSQSAPVGAGLSISEAVAGLSTEPEGTFLDPKRLTSNRRIGSRGRGKHKGRGRGRKTSDAPKPLPREERLKRHSAPEKGAPSPVPTGNSRPGTAGGLVLPSLPSAGGAQFVLRYEPKTRGPRAVSTRTQRLSRPRGGLAGNGSAAGDGAGPIGIVVRFDGSATAKYPNGNLAVSIDCDEGPDGEPCYRLYAGFRKDGSVACSFDGAGHGFANLASGRTCFTVNQDSGGFCMSADGGMEESWSGGAEAPEPPLVITKQLDHHLLLRYSTDPAVETELFFRCGSVKHKFVLGKNPTMDTWDPDDEYLYAERKKKKRLEKTFELPPNHTLKERDGPCAPNRHTSHRAPSIHTQACLAALARCVMGRGGVSRRYTAADQLQDIASLGAEMDKLTAALNANGV